MLRTRNAWLILFAVLISTFLLLGFFGREIFRHAPPIPERVVSADGRVFATSDAILTGQQVWQSMGGQQVGSIWGHGAYQAPDWSADWLHRECQALLDRWSMREHQMNYAELPAEKAAGLRERLRGELRKNTYDERSGALLVSDDRLAAITLTAEHYKKLFGGAPELAELRESYALKNCSVPEPERLHAMTQFFFWTSWACAAERPNGGGVSYTNNWPHEPLISNLPSAANVLWSIISVVLLLGAIGLVVAWQARGSAPADETPSTPAADPLDRIALTPSMAALAKYCAVIIALFVVQVLLGALTAHYTVEGQAFFGLPIGEWLPYSLTRTWHIQTALFWIATSFLTAGLFLAPVVGGGEPKFQALGVNVLFGALLLIVVGSLTGEWLAVQQKLGLDLSFWFGHQGYEYVELGRAWQILLFAGLGIWLALMLRGLWPALAKGDNRRSLVLLFVGASAAIGLFYGAGLLYGARTHLSVAEYWRWWVVHLWVEGFMEVFATVAMAFLFSQLGLIKPGNGARAVMMSASLFLLGGIPGTFHHLYFSGTPVSIMAIGATFSALEVVPLVLIGQEAFDTLRMGRLAPWMETYKWPIRFFVAVAFWNLIGAGLFGFLINPPIALYYMQGLNTTPVHGHAALFGVYGLLSLGLVLVVLRRLKPGQAWKSGALGFAFWSMNVGLALMILLSLLPIGILQAIASIETGLWFARSADFLQQPLLENLRWLRIVGDTIFLFGVGALAWFVLGLWTGWSFENQEDDATKADKPAKIEAPAASS